MALGIKITQILPLHPHRVYFQWDLINPTESGTYLFIIERSGSSEGPWETLNASLQNTYNYIDDLRLQPQLAPDAGANLFSLAKQIYYRVTVIPPSGCAHSAQTAPQGMHRIRLSPTQAGLRRRLQYDERVVLTRINNNQMVLLKRRHWGVRCDLCYDSLTRAVTREQCPHCYGTSFREGYWAPVLSYGRVYPPEAINVQVAQQGKSEVNKFNIQLLDIPLLQDDDLIIEVTTNDRYIVERQGRTEIQRKPVHQLVTVSLMARTCVEYTIPVDPRTTPPII